MTIVPGIDMLPYLKKQSVEEFLQPLPESGLQKITLEVKGIDYYGHRLGFRALVVLLDDPEGIIDTERHVFTMRANKHRPWKVTSPHLTIASVDTIHATSDIKKWVEERLPQSVTFLPINQHLEPVKAPTVPIPRPIFVSDNIILPNLEPQESATVRHLQPNSIPRSFLQSLEQTSGE